MMWRDSRLRGRKAFLASRNVCSDTTTTTTTRKIYGILLYMFNLLSGGRRGDVTLSHILRFCTGDDEEPVLGYALKPSIAFVESTAGFLPTANTCISHMKLPWATHSCPLPPMEVLHNLYDYAFSNAYFGII